MNQKVFPLFSEKECREFTGLNSPVNPSGPYTFYIGRLLIIHSMPSTDIGLSDCFFLPMSHSYFCFPGDSVSKEFACPSGDLGSIPGLGRSPGEGTAGNPLQYSCLENPMGRGAQRLQSTGWQRV